MKTARKAAFEVLMDVEKGRFIQDVFHREEILPKDVNLAEAIIYGTVKHGPYLDHILTRFVKRRDRLEKPVEIILKMAIYQLRFLDRVPDHAVVDESVKLTKKWPVAAPRALSMVF